MRRLFGTDGVRGVAGSPPLDEQTLGRLGRALVASLKDSGGPPAPRVCIGRDTRESCPGIVDALAAGIAAEGGAAADVGVLPTPALALLTRERGFAAGLMVSASHNPYYDNGVKVFNGSGSKLSDAAEIELESWIDRINAPTSSSGRAEDASAMSEAYLEFLDRCLDGHRLDGLTVAIDAAHGAAHALGPEAFRRAGARVHTIGDAPDGRNINEGVGSLHPEGLVRAVNEHGAGLGFAFDGDADRCIGCTAAGRLVDGDAILYYLARGLAASGGLPEKTIVATVMSNLGLEKALGKLGIRMLRTAVGDRYVLEAMIAESCRLGGEQSGHVILRDCAPTGDGVLTALTIARLVSHGGGPLDEALDEIPRFPQVLENVRVVEKPAIESHPVLGPAVESARERLGSDGRLVVRYSGTEPKARIMLEGVSEATIESLARELVSLFESELGVR